MDTLEESMDSYTVERGAGGGDASCMRGNVDRNNNSVSVSVSVDRISFHSHSSSAGDGLDFDLDRSEPAPAPAPAPAPSSSLRHCFSGHLKTYPHSEKMYLDAHFRGSFPGLCRPLGVCLLPSGRVVVSSSGDDSVRVLSPELDQVRRVAPPPPPLGRPFRRPSDLASLPDGRFAVRDDLGVHLFDEEGSFLRSVGQGAIGRCFGIATDGRGSIFTIDTSGSGSGSGSGSWADGGNADIIRMDVETGEVVSRIELCDVINRDPKSKCRFLSHSAGRLFVSDLGLNRVYVLGLRSNRIRAFGGSGREPGRFFDPAGIAIDQKGWALVADAANNRLQLFDNKRKYVGMAKLLTPVSRPSGIAFDADAPEPTIYVLNLNADSLAKRVGKYRRIFMPLTTTTFRLRRLHLYGNDRGAAHPDDEYYRGGEEEGEEETAEEDPADSPKSADMYYNSGGKEEEDDDEVDASPFSKYCGDGGGGGGGGRAPDTPGAGTIRIYHYQTSRENNSEQDYYVGGGGVQVGGDRGVRKVAATNDRRSSVAAAPTGPSGWGKASRWLVQRPALVLLCAFLVSLVTSALTSYVTLRLCR